MNEVETWLLQWFGPRVRTVKLDWNEHRATNYFDVGWIDSFGSVELVGDAEMHFNFAFTEADLADPRFGTLGGLADIISAHVKR